MIKLDHRNVETGSQELMVNFVTSSYKPELLKPLVDRISSIPQVVRNGIQFFCIPTTLNRVAFFLVCILTIPYLFILAHENTGKHHE